MEISLGTTATLDLQLSDGSTTQYPQAKVYATGSGTPVATVNLAHLAGGLYQGTHTPSAVGSYSVVYTVYSDSGRTTANSYYYVTTEQIVVSAAVSTQHGPDRD